MPINLQGSGNIAEGWGPAPALHAPELGGLVATILKDRLLREQMTKENIAETIKNAREERQSAQYLDAMKAAGLVPEGYDAGGMGGAKLGTGLAKMIQDQQEFAARERHQRAMEGFTERRTSLAEDVYSGGDGGSEDESQFYIDPDTGLRMQRTVKGPKLAPLYAQPSVAPQQSAKEEAVRPIYEQRVDERTKAEELKKKLEDRFGAYGTEKGKEGFEDPRHPGVSLTGGKKARVEAKYLKRTNAETEAKKREADLLKKYPGLATPEPAPAETGNAISTSKVTPGGGADQNLAPGFGNPASDADVAALDWARAHPDDPRSAAILRKLGIQ